MSEHSHATDGGPLGEGFGHAGDATPASNSSAETRRTSPTASGARREGCRVIAMLNQKGGVGKTTSTVNLGAALAESGQRVCLIDLDPQAHLTYHLGVEPDAIERSLYDLLIDPACAADEAVIHARPNLDVILSETDLAAAETELAGVEGRQTILRDKLRSIINQYDVVLLDCPPSLGLLTLNALATAGEVFVPMQAHFLALQGVGKLLETVGLVCQSINPDLRVTGIILCMHEQQTTLAKEIVNDLDAFFVEAAQQDVPWSACKVLRPAIRRNVKLAEAPSFGKTIFDYEPWCPGALDYRMLARELLTAWGRSVKQQSPSKPPAGSAAPQARPASRTPGVTMESKPATEAARADDVDVPASVQ